MPIPLAEPGSCIIIVFILFVITTIGCNSGDNSEFRKRSSISFTHQDPFDFPGFAQGDSVWVDIE